MGTESSAAEIDLLRSQIPFQSDGELVLPPQDGGGVGLVLVDVSNGFCTVGAGNLAPAAPNKQIEKMWETLLGWLGCSVTEAGQYLPFLIATFLISQSHHFHLIVSLVAERRTLFQVGAVLNSRSGCVSWYCLLSFRAQSSDFLVDSALKWLESDPNVVIKRKHCIDGYISSIEKDGSSSFADWVAKHQIKTILVLGICTDICVLDFASSALAARNIGRLPPLQDVVVYSEGCATYDLPVEVAMDMKGAVAHPQDLMHHIGLYMAKGRGAKVVDWVVLEPSA